MTDYPAVMVNANGDETAGDTLSFTDPDNQPVPPNSPPGGPFVAADSGDTPLVVTSGASVLLKYSADDEAFEANSGMLIAGIYDGSGLGSGIPYVTVQSGAPTTYQTPLVLDTTMTTGGLYAWDGSAYQKVALALV